MIAKFRRIATYCPNPSNVHIDSIKNCIKVKYENNSIENIFKKLHRRDTKISIYNWTLHD